jgi:hypothetical protein
MRRNKSARVSLMYSNNQQVYKRPKASIYREGARATLPLLPFILNVGFEAHGFLSLSLVNLIHLVNESE